LSIVVYGKLKEDRRTAMSCKCGSKNRTPDNVFKFVKKRGEKIHSENNLGIGLFVVPAPEYGILEYKIVPVAGISYKECLKRGSICESYQWVPKGYVIDTVEGPMELHTVEDIKKIKILDCSSNPCPSCPMGCTCFDDDSTCNDNVY
jgi:hypothetical protein